VRPDSPGLGTEWVDDHRGASIGELLDATGRGCTDPRDYRRRTGLRLTGRPLDHCDRRRIADAIDWRREEE